MHADLISQRLERLLSEPLESVRDRQANTLERLIGSLDRPLMLFGASHLGRRALALLKELGCPPCAFLDNNPALWGESIESVPVFSPAQFVAQYTGELPAVICTIWSGHIHDCMADRLTPLQQLGFQRITLFGHLA